RVFRTLAGVAERPYSPPPPPAWRVTFATEVKPLHRFASCQRHRRQPPRVAGIRWRSAVMLLPESVSFARHAPPPLPDSRVTCAPLGGHLRHPRRAGSANMRKLYGSRVPRS